MTSYTMILRHEPDTQDESESGWWYSHQSFDDVDDAAAVATARRIGAEIGGACASQSKSAVGYSCCHSVDEVYRVDGTELVSIYDDGVHQSRGPRTDVKFGRRE